MISLSLHRHQLNLSTTKCAWEVLLLSTRKVNTLLGLVCISVYLSENFRQKNQSELKFSTRHHLINISLGFEDDPIGYANAYFR